MPGEADAVMFEVYQQASGNRRYRVVYFTELDEAERDEAIDAAMAGQSFFDGFITAANVAAAKGTIVDFVARLNQGGAGTREELASLLAPFLTR